MKDISDIFEPIGEIGEPEESLSEKICFTLTMLLFAGVVVFFIYFAINLVWIDSPTAFPAPFGNEL